MKQKGKGTVGNIIIGILTFIAVVLLIATIGVFNEDVRVYTYTTDSMYYCVRSGEYYRLSEYVKKNKSREKNPSSDMLEYYAVAEYYDAELMGKAYEKSGDMQKAMLYKEKQSEAETRMGDLHVLKEEIDSLLAGEKISE